MTNIYDAAEAIARSRELAVKHRKAARLYDELAQSIISECGKNLENPAARAVFITETEAQLALSPVRLDKHGRALWRQIEMYGQDATIYAEYLWRRLDEARKIQRDHDAGTTCPYDCTCRGSG